MKKQLKHRGISILLALCMALSLAGCAQNLTAGTARDTESSGLDLDYIEGSGTQDSAKTSDEGGAWYDWVADAFNFGEAQTSASTGGAGDDAPDSVREIYEESGGAASSVPNAGGNRQQAGEQDTKEDTPGPQQPSEAQETSGAKQDSGNKDNGRDNRKDSGAQTQQPPQQNAGQTTAPTEPAAPSEPAAPEQTPSTTEKTVTMSIRCDTAVNNGMHLESKWAGIVPASGVILNTTTFEIEDGDTALDVLIQARDRYKLHMEYSGSASSAYVEGINNLYEFDGGRWSGWMYSVNGWYPNYGCGQYFLQAGDVIEWNYTCDLGIDLNAGMEGAEEWKETHD